MKFTTLIFVCVVLISLSFARRYDFIIMGGGSPGAVLAARLSEDRKTKVLLIERGDNRCELFKNIVGFWGTSTTVPPPLIPDFFERSIYNEHYYTREVNTVSRYIPVPYLAGGAGTTNGNAFSRLSADELNDFNSPLWTFDQTTEDWKDLYTYQQCVTSSCNTTAHGTRGPLVVDIYPPDNVLALVNNTLAAAFNLTWDEDSNDGTNRGISLMHRNIKVDENGIPARQEPYCNFLQQFIGQRKNLDVVTQATVLKADLRNNGKHFVEYLHQGNVYRERAKKEIIFAAGAIETPKLMKLSGIGPCAELQKFDIECIVENDEVGENLLDSVQDGLLYVNPPPSSFNPGSIVVAYFDDYEIAATSIKVPTPTAVLDGTFVLVIDLQHGGTGSVLLNSANPLEDPVLSLNIYTVVPNSIDRLRDRLRVVRQAFESVNQQFGFPYFTAVSPSLDELPVNATDQQIDDYLRGPNGATPEWHFTGSTSLHKVVDDRLRLIDNNGNVYPGVRVVGNSIVPNVIRSHSTSSTAPWIGQVASRFIKEDYNI